MSLIKVEVMVKKTIKIRVGESKSLVMAEIENWEQKKEVMNKEKELKKDII